MNNDITREDVMNSTYPSATRLARMFVAGKLPDGIPEHILANASAKGTAVHKYAEIKAHGIDVPLDADYYEFEQQVDAFLESIKDEEIIGTEIPFIDNIYRIKGFIDLLTKDSDGVYHVYDYKTSAKINDFGYPIQLKVYEAAVEELIGGRIRIGGHLVHITRTKWNITDVPRDNGLVAALSYVFGTFEEQIRKADK